MNTLLLTFGIVIVLAGIGIGLYMILVPAPKPSAGAATPLAPAPSAAPVAPTPSAGGVPVPITPKPTILPAPAPVILYTDSDFGGQAITLPVGRYPFSQFASLVPNDSVSSVRVPSGTKLTLFQDDIGSASTVFTNNSVWVPNNGFPNDAASAAIVESA